MGFLDFAGEILGRLGAMAQEITALKSEYEDMNNTELIREHKSLKGKVRREEQNRFAAVNSILKDRGIIRGDDE